MVKMANPDFVLVLSPFGFLAYMCTNLKPSHFLKAQANQSTHTPQNFDDWHRSFA